jgi:hypothetical protein
MSIRPPLRRHRIAPRRREDPGFLPATPASKEGTMTRRRLMAVLAAAALGGLLVVAVPMANADPYGAGITVAIASNANDQQIDISDAYGLKVGVINGEDYRFLTVADGQYWIPHTNLHKTFTLEAKSGGCAFSHWEGPFGEWRATENPRSFRHESTEHIFYLKAMYNC